jgi:hypothetical protein
VLLGVHTEPPNVVGTVKALNESGATAVEVANWSDSA